MSPGRAIVPSAARHVLAAGQGEEFGFVAEHDVDRSARQVLQHAPVPFDKERVRQRERDGGAGAACRAEEAFDECGRVGQVEDVALEVDELGVPDDVDIDARRVEPAADAERGRHRPLGVGCDDHVAPPGRGLVACGIGHETLQDGVHARRFEVGGETVAEVVGRHRADESRAATERGDPDRAVRHGPAGDLAALADDRPDPFGCRDVDECHRAERQSERLDDRVGANARWSISVLPTQTTSKRFGATGGRARTARFSPVTPTP